MLLEAPTPEEGPETCTPPRKQGRAGARAAPRLQGHQVRASGDTKRVETVWKNMRYAELDISGSSPSKQKEISSWHRQKQTHRRDVHRPGTSKVPETHPAGTITASHAVSRNPSPRTPQTARTLHTGMPGASPPDATRLSLYKRPQHHRSSWCYTGGPPLLCLVASYAV